jgi:hypothetical protein
MTLEEAKALHRYWTKRRNETDTRRDEFKGYVLEVRKYESIIREMLTAKK